MVHLRVHLFVPCLENPSPGRWRSDCPRHLCLSDMLEGKGFSIQTRLAWGSRGYQKRQASICCAYSQFCATAGSSANPSKSCSCRFVWLSGILKGDCSHIRSSCVDALFVIWTGVTAFAVVEGTDFPSLLSSARAEGRRLRHPWKNCWKAAEKLKGVGCRKPGFRMDASLTLDPWVCGLACSPFFWPAHL